MTPYYAHNIKYRIIYKDLKTLLLAHDCCRLMADNYLQIEEKAIRNFPIIQYTEKSGKWKMMVLHLMKEDIFIEISKIIKSLQYCTEKK